MLPARLHNAREVTAATPGPRWTTTMMRMMRRAPKAMIVKKADVSKTGNMMAAEAGEGSDRGQ